MSDSRDKLMDYQDDLGRFIDQTDAVLVALSDIEHIGNVPPGALTAVLWLVQDRIQDIKATADKITKIAREIV